MIRHPLSPKTKAALWLIPALLALIILAAGLSDFQLRPGRPFRILSEEPIGSGDPATPLTLSPDLLVAIVTGAVFLLGLLFIVIRLLQGKRAIKEELYNLLFLTLFIWAAHWLLTQLAAAAPPDDFTPIEAESGPPLEIEGLLEGVETFNRDEIAAAPPPDWLVWLIAGSLALLIAGAGFFIYHRWFTNPAAATLQQLAQDAEATLLQLHLEDANLRDVVIRAYYDMSQTVMSKGYRRQDGMTPREFMDRLIQAGLPHRDVERLTRLFEEVRYGHITPGERQKREAIGCMQTIITAAGRVSSF
ncbi:MAG: DUF4129 domain-containing protein [Anaerolineae bacterium]|nr:DUF4129 domain-containing protein [Anaerolineae bacterium]